MIPCQTCGQKLYPLERMTLNSKVFHKNGCAKCSVCRTNLNPNNFAFIDDQLFCKTHYLANFSRSGGRYSFSFGTGKEQNPNLLEGNERRELSTTTNKSNKLAAFLASANGTSQDKTIIAPKLEQIPESGPTPIKETLIEQKQTLEPAVLSFTSPSKSKLSAFLASTNGSTPKQGMVGEVLHTPMKQTETISKPSENNIRSFDKMSQEVSSIKPKSIFQEEQVSKRCTEEPPKISLRERIALYSAQAKAQNNNETVAKKLESEKRSLAEASATDSTPSKVPKTTPFRVFRFGTGNANADQNESKRFAEESQPSMTLKERIASYQAKATGQKSPARKKSGSFRERVSSFVKTSSNSTFPAPKSDENYAGIDVLRKICKETLEQIARASASTELDPKTQTLSLEFIEVLKGFEERMEKICI